MQASLRDGAKRLAKGAAAAAAAALLLAGVRTRCFVLHCCWAWLTDGASNARHGYNRTGR